VGVVAQLILIAGADVGPGAVGVGFMAGIPGVDGGGIGLDLEVQDPRIDEPGISQQVADPRNRKGVGQTVDGIDLRQSVRPDGCDRAFREQRVHHGRLPSTVAEVL
ncbi:MAG: hypothetical protein ACK55I_34090, partial [bacterium]